MSDRKLETPTKKEIKERIEACQEVGLGFSMGAQAAYITNDPLAEGLKMAAQFMQDEADFLRRLLPYGAELSEPREIRKYSGSFAIDERRLELQKGDDAERMKEIQREQVAKEAGLKLLRDGFFEVEKGIDLGEDPDEFTPSSYREKITLTVLEPAPQP